MARILIVEDDESVRAFTQRALAAEGHVVETAGDGEEGLERVRSAPERYDLVLSDIRMPIMDGIEMTRRIGALSPRTPILLMTGYAEQRERAVELENLVKGVVEKPFTLPEIRERVRRALG
jgi:two-component system, cell cycle response regulator CpdR